MKNRKMKVLSALIIQIIVLSACAGVFASTMINYNESLYKLVLNEAVSTDYSDGALGQYNNNNRGSVEIATVDEDHGNSAVLSAENVESYTSEGPWIQFNGDKSSSLLMYELDIYAGELTGEVKFQIKANGSVDVININSDGIGYNDARAEIVFGEWNNIRLLFDCKNQKLFLYVNDSEPIAIVHPSMWRMANGTEYMRMIFVNAVNAYVAVDNFNCYSLEIIPEDYEAPRLSLLLPEGKITEKESTQIEAQIETATEIKKVAFYVNDELIYTDYASPYILEHLFLPGEYSVRAEATDLYGETGETTVEITSLADTRPRIEIALEDGKTYDRALLGDVLVSVTMSDADLTHGTVYVDGKEAAVLDKGDNSIDLSTLSLGSHTIAVYAENNFGENSEKSLQITVSKSSDDVIWSEDFNDGTLLGQINSDGQFTRLEVVRNDFKESLLVGANTTQDTSKQGAWIPISLKNTATVAIVDFDIYFSDINGGGFVLQAMPKWVELFKITNKGIVAGTKTYPFEAKRWYHMTIEIDPQNSKLSIYLDNELIVDGLAVSNIPEAIDSLRAISMLQGTQETYYAIDNIVARRVMQAASITNITSANGDTNIVSATDRELKVYFSGGVQPASVYPAKFKIGGAVIEKAVYDADNFCVTLTLAKPLSSGRYCLETAENLVMGNGEIYAEKLYGNFTVVNSLFEASAAAVNNGEITGVILNNSQDEKTVYMIANLYNGETLKSSTAKELTLVSGENNISEQIEGFVSGDRVEVFLWNSLRTPVCFMAVD